MPNSVPRTHSIITAYRLLFDPWYNTTPVAALAAGKEMRFNIKSKRFSNPERFSKRRGQAKAVATVLLLSAAVIIAPPVSSGGVATGNATEWTQLLNNAELGKLVGVESESLSKTSQILSSNVEQLRTQIQTYQTILRTIEKLPDSFLAEAMKPVQELQSVMAEAKSIAQNAKTIDTFLRSDLIENPLFQGEVLEEAQLSERYDEWLEKWEGSLKTGLKKVGMTLEDVETEAGLLDSITKRFGTEKGHLQALQVSNEIASSFARQMNDLRALTATQAEQTTVAWSRVLADLDAKQRGARDFEVEVNQSLDNLRHNPGGERSVHDILGLGRP